MGGTPVRIIGAGFTDATEVDFGTVAASSFTVDSDTQITAVSPAETVGTVDVTVVSPDGTSATSSADQFLYYCQNPLFVTTAADVVDPTTDLTSLREAIAYANSNPGDDTITFDPSLAGQTITLTGGELELTDTTGTTTITGLGADS